LTRPKVSNEEEHPQRMADVKAYTFKRNESLASVAEHTWRANHPRVECLAAKRLEGGNKLWQDVFPRATKECSKRRRSVVRHEWNANVTPLKHQRDMKRNA